MGAGLPRSRRLVDHGAAMSMIEIAAFAEPRRKLYSRHAAHTEADHDLGLRQPPLFPAHFGDILEILCRYGVKAILRLSIDFLAARARFRLWR